MRSKAISLIFFLALTFFLTPLALTFNVNAQTDEEYEPECIDLELSSYYSFRGQSFTIKAVTTFEDCIVRIYAPNGSLIYERPFNDGQTRTVTINNDMDYGVYLIEAVKNNVRFRRAFSVVDITGFEPVSFPHIRQFKGMNITFNRDWSITANDGVDTLTIDFKSLKWLADVYNLDYVARANDDIFIVRLSKPAYDISIDWLFIETHKGLKIAVNGTLDKARIFDIAVKPKVLRELIKMRETARSGNLILDWSDMKKAGDVFTYQDGVLSVSLPKTFFIDPILEQSGYESGDYSDFDATEQIGGGTINVTTTQVYQGTYSSNGTVTGLGQAGVAREDLVGYTTLYYQWEGVIKALPTNGRNHFFMFNYDENNLPQVRFGVRRVAGIMYLAIAGYHPAWTMYTSACAIGVDCWNNYEFGIYAHDTEGWLRGWVNGTLKIEVTGVDTYRSGDLRYNRIGNSDSGEASTLLNDNFYISDNYMGNMTVIPNAPTLIYPANQSTGIEPDPDLTVRYTHPDGEEGLIYFFNNETGAHLGTVTGVANNSNAVYTWSNLNYTQEYNWHAIASDEENNSTLSDIFIFTVREEYTETMILIFMICCVCLLLGVLAQWIPFVGIIAVAFSLLVLIPLPITEPAYMLAFQVGTLMATSALTIFAFARRIGEG